MPGTQAHLLGAPSQEHTHAQSPPPHTSPFVFCEAVAPTYLFSFTWTLPFVLNSFSEGFIWSSKLSLASLGHLCSLWSLGGYKSSKMV